ncbi:regulator of telomere elongation helicase 1 homolog isoform X2 [Silene latifolia]|uniref:regulator of telomere elongation helicase 1 homolog isoform X2 n=2 Tax=Silene latifolia TaxID=37657 RepID=UPI003D788DDE
MPIYNINGVSVDFPYEAYDSQIEYMDKVIQALQGKCNALLESPTGTGKTLCLLCATLAYRASLGPFSTGKSAIKNESEVRASQSQTGSLLPKIVYTSRTHSQLRQVIHELKKTNYRPKMMVLGSREQLCIHEKVKLLRGRAQSNSCQYHRKRSNKRACGHYKITADFLKSNPYIGDEPVDIEDLVNIGRSCGPCPYYMSRELLKGVDILFAPYNYLIDRSFKDRIGIEWNSSILIFDEAHNLEGICADAASFDLPAALLSACISEAKKCIDLSVKRRDIDKSADPSCSPDNFAILRALLLKLEKRIAEVPIVSREFGFTRPGPYIYELLGELNVTSENATKLTGIIEQAVLLLEEDTNGTGGKESNSRLETLGEILNLIFRDGGTSHAKYYRVHVQESAASDFYDFTGNVSKARMLSWWCFNPGICLEDFSKRGVGSVILTSGTLSPLDSFAYELKLEFPIRLENPHVISSNQIWTGVVSEGPSGYSFNSSYRNRDVLEYKQELGNAIVNFARIVPDGLLVFFASYYVMEQCISCWKDNSNRSASSQLTIWARICKFKQPVIEPRQSALFSSSIEDFNSKLKDPSTSGAVFFAVCRGKVSEGLDFADQYGRAVIITGLPFATRTDPKVRLKREFLDESARNKTLSHKPLTGEEWYDQQASRAVNQAVGRVIRHRHDYGAIILCDERFATSHRQAQVSRWIQPHIKCYSKFGDVVYSLTRFFRVEVPRLIKVEPLVKVEPLETVSNVVKACGEKVTQPLNGCCSGKKVNSLGLDEDCCIVSSTVGIKVEKLDDVSLLQEFLPANRSSLTFQKQTQATSAKLPSYLFGKQKLLSTGTTCRNEMSDLVDLADDASPFRRSDAMFVSSLSKRQKIPKIEPDFTEHKRSTCEKTSVIKETLSKCSRGKSILTEKYQDNLDIKKEGSLEIGGNMTSRERATNQANLDSHSASTLNDKAKGQNFLIQVQEILDKSEYKEFLGYLKALKSRAMTISPVLQSIVKLFSGQDRRSLLSRFKHYIPEKYHSLYEEYCTSIGGTSEP